MLQAHEIDCGSVKPFLLTNAERVKAHVLAMASERGRPFEYLSSKLRKIVAARKLAERDGIEECFPKLRCGKCVHDKPLAFSCKHRGFCRIGELVVGGLHCRRTALWRRITQAAGPFWVES